MSTVRPRILCVSRAWSSWASRVSRERKVLWWIQFCWLWWSWWREEEGTGRKEPGRLMGLLTLGGHLLNGIASTHRRAWWVDRVLSCSPRENWFSGLPELILWPAWVDSLACLSWFSGLPELILWPACAYAVWNKVESQASLSEGSTVWEKVDSEWSKYCQGESWFSGQPEWRKYYCLGESWVSGQPEWRKYYCLGESWVSGQPE